MEAELNILLVEDDAIDAEAVMRMLRPKDTSVWQHYHCNVVWMSSLTEAVNACADHSFDLLLLDMGLPDGNKETLIETLRQYYPNLPIVVLTGLSDQQVALDSLRRGAEDYLVKGNVTRVELLRCLAYSIERYQLRAKLEETASTLAKQKEVLQAIIDNMSDGVVVTDEDGQITLCNPAAQHMLQGQPDVHARPEAASLSEQNVHELLPQLTLSYVREQGRNATFQEVITIGSLDNADDRFLSITAKPFDFRGGFDRGYVAVLHDITRHKKVEQLKDEFISIISHELRTPLTSINGSLGLMMNGAMGEVPSWLEQMMDMAFRNCERLSTLINDLLDVQQIELGKLNVQLQPTGLTSIVRRAVEMNGAYARSHNVSLKIDAVLDDEGRVNGDERRLLQVMENLLSNAIKFSPADGIVSVELTRRDRCLEVSVRNQGRAIPLDAQASIFEKFVQADSTTRRSKGGTGLGLYITKYLVEMHGGRIWFETSPESGTQFAFTLPEILPVDQPPACSPIPSE